jgi:hypothetical protein
VLTLPCELRLQTLAHLLLSERAANQRAHPGVSPQPQRQRPILCEPGAENDPAGRSWKIVSCDAAP